MDILHSGLWYISLYNDATQDLQLSIHARIKSLISLILYCFIVILIYLFHN